VNVAASLRDRAGLAILAILVVCVGPISAGCSDPEPSDRAPGTDRPPRPPRAERVARMEQEAGLDQCGALLENLSPTSVPTFSTLMRECAGLYAVRECRDVLREGEFSRPRVHEVCSRVYCEELRAPRPSFCTRELPSDAEFLEQFGDFSEAVLRSDLRRVMDREGAGDIAELMAQLIRDQANR
jgi:hypothetical protein